MEILTVKDVSFSYPERTKKALDHINLAVNEGDFMVLCGPSGSGKTTLLRLLKRELTPHGKKSGTISLFQKDQEDQTLSPFDVGFVMQNPHAQVVTDKVWHELSFTLENMGKSSDEIRRITGEMASFFGISSWYNQGTDTLSGGQIQLLNLASVMASSPKLLLLDEPLSQLDPVSASDFLSVLARLNRELSLTVILAEHRLEEVLPMADQVAVMDSGKILLRGAPQEIATALKNSGEKDKILPYMPCAVQVFTKLSGTGHCPLTVKQGREFLHNAYQNTIKSPRRQPSAVSSQPQLALRDVWFRYEKKGADILKNLSLTVYKGETLCILGANGAGKSTLLQVMAAQNKPYSGKIIKDTALATALLPQNPVNLFLKDTLQEDFAAVLQRHSTAAEHIQSPISDICATLAIENLLGCHPLDLSGGEQQKAAIGKLLLLQPQVLLLDEPTKGIDICAKKELAALFKRLNKKGLTIVMVTHDIEFAAVCATRCALLFDGQIVSQDPPVRFFCNNTFYTTAANRMARTLYDGCITSADITALCRQNGKIRGTSI